MRAWLTGVASLLLAVASRRAVLRRAVDAPDLAILGQQVPELLRLHVRRDAAHVEDAAPLVGLLHPLQLLLRQHLLGLPLAVEQLLTVAAPIGCSCRGVLCRGRILLLPLVLGHAAASAAPWSI
jgi:hypothetical protein